MSDFSRQTGHLATALAVAAALILPATTGRAPTATRSTAQAETTVEDVLLRPGARPLTLAAATPATPSTRGYTLEDPAIVGITARGLRVQLTPDRTNPASLSAALQHSVAAIHQEGLPVSWGGGATAATTAITEGTVQVTVKAADCQGLGPVLAYTSTGRRTLTGGAVVVTGATITVCPVLFDYPTWVVRAAVEHELGHAVGLDHFNGSYAGATEVMNYAITAADADGTYHAGDRNGLRALAAGTARLSGRLSAPIVSFRPGGRSPFTARLRPRVR